MEKLGMINWSVSSLQFLNSCISGSSVNGALSICKQFAVHKCGHEKKPVPASKCLESMITNNNPNRLTFSWIRTCWTAFIFTTLKKINIQVLIFFLANINPDILYLDI
jgi:hypothetical protein